MELETKSSYSANQKRKFSEYHDPDYPQDYIEPQTKRSISFQESDSASGLPDTCNYNGSKRPQQSTPLSAEQKEKKICDIIAREFDREISYKEQQLEEINNRLAKAKNLLHQIRYAIVSEYYNKQAISLTDKEASAIRGPTIFQKEPKGPQIPLHPSLRKIIGKKPKSLEEILRALPQREAAKNAKTTIKERARSKKEEKRIQRMIKESGIVIDHSKHASQQQTSSVTSCVESVVQTKVPRHIGPKTIEQPISKLNAARLNNQTKHLIVVGNTSKYIGDEKASDNSTHKWLIYVHAKTDTLIEKFVTKVRFFLHSSYRPNDVVDVDCAPFQLARRGWGEFPVRIQLFFDARLQQKPVQLVHKLILDKTLSGLQTMGSETLVEIWLRTDSFIASALKNDSATVNSANTPNLTKPQNSPNSKKLPHVSYHNEKMSPKSVIDDNLFDFLDKIENSTICEDIEKIQPTVIDSPIIDSNIFAMRKPLGNPPANTITESLNQICKETFNSNTCQREDLSDIKSLTPELVSKPEEESTFASNRIDHTNQLSIDNGNLFNGCKPKPYESVTQNSKMEILEGHNNGAKFNTLTKNTIIPISSNDNVNGKILPASLKRKIMSTNVSTKSTKEKTVNSFKTQPARLLQKKLVQIVDKEGNVKYFQMLVPAPSNNLNPTVAKLTSILSKSPENAAAPEHCFIERNNHSSVKPPIEIFNHSENVPMPIQPIKTGNCNTSTQVNGFVTQGNDYQKDFYGNGSKDITPMQLKRNVFHKEGKVYIIDPIQSKLRQQQTKQVSLLKPKISLLKSHQTEIIVSTNNIAFDHNYTASRSFGNENHTSPDIDLLSRQMSSTPTRSRAGAVALMRKPRTEYRQEIEQDFWSSKFVDMRTAIEFLLRRLPLITSKANDFDYRRFYPFAVSSTSDFRNCTPLKRKALEWLRAKYISRIISAHFSFCNAIDINLWTTREIVLFARLHAYTPVIDHNLLVYSDKHNSFGGNQSSSELLTRLVKTEIKKEHRLLHFETITSNQKVVNWTENAWKSVKDYLDEQRDELEIDIINDTSSNADNLFNGCGRKSTMTSPLKSGTAKLWLPLQKNLEAEGLLVKNICRETGIRLQPEEIQLDVMHPTAQTVLAQALHVFIDDLLRHSIAAKMRNSESVTCLKRSEIAANSNRPFEDIIVEPNDIRNTINSKPEFDFLSNKHFGTIKLNDSMELG